MADITLPEMGQIALDACYQQVQELKRRTSGDIGRLGNDCLNDLSNMTSRVSRAMAGLIKEMRALEKDAREWASTMGHEEKREVIRDFFGGMPPEEQRQLVQELTRDLNAGKRMGA